jgi:hypothetical protein
MMILAIGVENSLHLSIERPRHAGAGGRKSSGRRTSLCTGPMRLRNTRAARPVHKTKLRICEPHFAHKGPQACEQAKRPTQGLQCRLDKAPGGGANAART